MVQCESVTDGGRSGEVEISPLVGGRRQSSLDTSELDQKGMCN